MYSFRKPAAEWTEDEIRDYYRDALAEAAYLAGHTLYELEDLDADPQL